MTWITENWEHILAILGGVYALALAIVKITPTSRDDEVLAKAPFALKMLAAILGLDLKQGLEAKDPKKADTKRTPRPPLALLLVLLCLSGCNGIGAAYVKADQLTYDAIADEYVNYVNNDGKLDSDQRDRRQKTVTSWAARLDQGVASED